MTDASEGPGLTAAKTFDEVEVGMSVMIEAFSAGYGQYYRHTGVIKVTKTQIHTGRASSPSKWRKADGRSVGGSDDRRIQIITPEIRAAYRRSRHLDEIYHLSVDDIRAWSVGCLRDVAMAVQAAQLDYAQRLNAAKADDDSEPGGPDD